MFIAVKFNDTDTRTYTYTSDIAYAIGDRVLVDGRGEPKIVTVAAVDLPAQSFDCKPIIGLAPANDDDQDWLPPTENPRAVIGGNTPPDPIDEALAPFGDVITEAEGWLDGKAVENEAQMKSADALIKEVKAARKAVDDARDTATKPLHEAWKSEVARWKPTQDDLDRIVKGLVGIVDGFKRKLAAEKESARKEAERKAWDATRAAQEAARLADPTNIEATRAAAAAIAEAEAKQAEARIAAKDTVKGLRWYDCYEIIDHRAALHWIAANDREAITAFIEAYVAKNHKAFPETAVRNYREQRAI